MTGAATYSPFLRQPLWYEKNGPETLKGFGPEFSQNSGAFRKGREVLP